MCAAYSSGVYEAEKPASQGSASCASPESISRCVSCGNISVTPTCDSESRKTARRVSYRRFSSSKHSREGATRANMRSARFSGMDSIVGRRVSFITSPSAPRQFSASE